MSDGGHQIIQGFQMLNINGGIHTDTGSQQFLHILISF